ncbi:coiled-coil domain-containing protein [Herpetosiphon geysericola]|uniref:Uncharacterized protein n=1 Tax=Herpetosiphon geysericola TaxID=70996 RepID=A0A0P6YA29_9CHLR|nr:hypothetical protein [Herpetosiphon geysericola]KPL86113.1 hypothetical protein SE18_14690 [Herpetosiphon geysericola]
MVTDAADLLQRIGGKQAQAQVATIQQQVMQAAQSLASKHANDARQSASVASEQLIKLQPLLDRLKSAEAQLKAAEEYLPSINGKRAAGVKQLVAEGTQVLQNAAVQITETDASDLVDEAERIAQRAYKLGPDFASTQQSFNQRLEAVNARGLELNGRLEASRNEFAEVNQYAPESWSDIRGNGSEAASAVAQAHQLWQTAQAKIAPDQDDWAGGLEELETAEERLVYADTLLNAISKRLADLREAQKSATNQIEDAKRDIKLGWGYVRNNDADVGKAPEKALSQAESLLQNVESQLTREKPNWISVLQQVTQARQYADQALAGARSEVETMNAKRAQAKDLAKAAQAELGKLQNFAQLHPVDAKPEHRKKIDAIGRTLSEADTALLSADRSEEEARAGALDSAIGGYNTVISQAAPLYSAMYESFQSLEVLRREASEAVQVAQQSLNNANQWYTQYGHVLPANSNGRSLLSKAQQTLRQYNPNADAEELKKIAASAREANGYAHEAAQIIQTASQSYQQSHQPQYGGQYQSGHYSGRRDNDVGDLLTGMFIGSMMNSGRDHHHGGGWGSGGGGWGGGSSGGGSIFDNSSSGSGDSGGGWGGMFSGGSGDSGGDWGGGGDSSSGDSGGSW